MKGTIYTNDERSERLRSVGIDFNEKRLTMSSVIHILSYLLHEVFFLKDVSRKDIDPKDEEFDILYATPGEIEKNPVLLITLLKRYLTLIGEDNTDPLEIIHSLDGTVVYPIVDHLLNQICVSNEYLDWFSNTFLWGDPTKTNNEIENLRKTTDALKGELPHENLDQVRKIMQKMEIENNNKLKQLGVSYEEIERQNCNQEKFKTLSEENQILKQSYEEICAQTDEIQKYLDEAGHEGDSSNEQVIKWLESCNNLVAEKEELSKLITEIELQTAVIEGDIDKLKAQRQMDCVESEHALKDLRNQHNFAKKETALKRDELRQILSKFFGHRFDENIDDCTKYLNKYSSSMEEEFKSQINKFKMQFDADVFQHAKDIMKVTKEKKSIEKHYDEKLSKLIKLIELLENNIPDLD